MLLCCCVVALLLIDPGRSLIIESASLCHHDWSSAGAAEYTITILPMLSPVKCVLASRLSPLTSLSSTGHVAWTKTEYDATTYQGVADAYCWHTSYGVRRITENAACTQLQLFDIDGEVKLFCIRAGQLWQYDLENCRGIQVTMFPLDIKFYYIYRSATNEVNLLCCMDVNRRLSPANTSACDKTAPQSSGVLYDSLMVRQWTQWKVPGRYHHLFQCHLAVNNDKIVTAEPSTLVDLFFGMAVDCPGKATHGSLSNFDISPDGYTLAVTCRVHCDESGDSEVSAAWTTRTSVYTIDLTATIENGSKPKLHEITASDASWKGYQSAPTFSPDGKLLAILSQATYQYESDKRVIRIFDFHTQQFTTLTDDIDISFNGIQWESDISLIATAMYRGNQRIFRIAIHRCDNITLGGISLLQGDACRSSPVLALIDNTPHLFYLESSVEHSSAVRSLNLMKNDAFIPFVPSPSISAGPRTVLSLSPDCYSTLQSPFVTVANAPHQHYFYGAAGDLVHCWYVPPADVDVNYTQRHPLLLLIHGGPQGNVMNQWHLRWNMNIFAAAGYGIVGVNFHGSAGFGKAFTDSIHGDWGGKPYEDCLQCVEYILSQYDYLDKDRVGAMGSSYGGYMINWINSHSKRFKCLVCHAGLFSLSTFYYTTEELWFPEWEFGLPWENPEMYEKHTPDAHVASWSTPTLVTHGGKDYRVVDTQGIATFTALQRRGIPSKFLYYPDEGHWITAPKNSVHWYECVLDWLDSWLKNK